MRETLDAVVIGAGPAGLTALTYLARFHRKAVALGAGGPKARLLLIERSYNLPGYPDGISGERLLARLREQAEEMGGEVLESVARRVERESGLFRVELEDGQTLTARRLVLAMGVVDREPDIPGVRAHVGDFLRYCPVCDGFEHTGQALGILGWGPQAARHALFLRTFSDRIALFTHGRPADCVGPLAGRLAAHGIALHPSPVASILEEERQGGQARGCGVALQDGSEHPLQVLYGALGCDVNLGPVRDLGLRLDPDGYVVTDANQETSIPGIYAAGDLVNDINQISVAFGQAAVAAVRIHSALLDEEGVTA